MIIVIIVSILIVSQAKVYTKHVFDNVSYTCNFDSTEVHVGEPITFTETLYNGKYLPIPWIKAELTTSKYLSFSEECSAVTYSSRFVSSCYAVSGNKSVTRQWKISATKRGVYSIENVVLSACDLLGMNETSKPIPNISATITVLPLEVSTPEIEQHILNVTSDFETQHGLITDPFIVNGIREYTGKEPLNRIHWKSSAKSNDLMVVKNGYSYEPYIEVYMYIQERCEETLAEKTLTIACSIACKLSRSNIPVKFSSNCSASSKSAFGKEHALNIKRLCSTITLTPKTLTVKSNQNGSMIVVTPLNNKRVSFPKDTKVIFTRL